MRSELLAINARAANVASLDEKRLIGRPFGARRSLRSRKSGAAIQRREFVTRDP
jgi:hypothetical protein